MGRKKISANVSAIVLSKIATLIPERMPTITKLDNHETRLLYRRPSDASFIFKVKSFLFSLFTSMAPILKKSSVASCSSISKRSSTVSIPTKILSESTTGIILISCFFINSMAFSILSNAETLIK